MKVCSPNRKIQVSKYIKVISILRGDELTEKEIEVLTDLILIPEKYKYARLGKLGIQYLASKYKTTPTAVGIHIRSLKAKGYIYGADDGKNYVNRHFLSLPDPINLYLEFENQESKHTYTGDIETN